MKWPTESPKNLWILLDDNETIVGFSFDGLTAISNYPNLRRAIRYDRATTDEQEHDRIAGYALEQLKLL